ncbi:MAG: prepilin-type N-terminal cleavage/methylation domain-containing protein [Hyphomicrobiaceae bacterium]|nr:MAG: prepilin-type N-terminal cleavage/methylation domain-containing protein [Hyphomicrobiaceae bacterium]
MRSVIRNRHGYTLVELLVVLSILTMASMSLAYLAKPSRSAIDPEIAVQMLVTHLRAARTNAIRANQEITLGIDLTRREFGGAPDLAAYRMADGVEMHVVTAGDRIIKEGLVRVRFFADGSCSGALIILRRGTRGIEVSVDWLTGATSTRIVDGRHYKS